MDDPPPAVSADTTPTTTTKNSTRHSITSTTTLAVVIPFLLVVSLLLMGLLAVYVRRRRASAKAEDRWAWRRTLGAGRSDTPADMWTGGWEREKKPDGWAWSPGAHHTNDKSQDVFKVTPSKAGRRISTTYSKPLPVFPGETQMTSTHFSPPEAALTRTGSPPTLDVFFLHRESLGDASSSLASFPMHGLDSPFHIPTLASLASFSAASSATMSPPQRPGHPEPSFSPSSSFGVGFSPPVRFGQRGAMSAQPSTETFEALTPSTSQAEMQLPTPPKKALARSTSSPPSSRDSPVVDIVRGGPGNLQRWNSAKNYRNVDQEGDSASDGVHAAGHLCDTSPLKIVPRSKSPGSAALACSAASRDFGPPSSFRPSVSDPTVGSGIASQGAVRRESNLYRSGSTSNNTLSAAATAQLAALSFSLSQLPPAFLAHPPPSPSPSNVTTNTFGEPETAEARRRRLATPRPDTGGDPCQVVKVFGLPKDGENCLRGGFESRPVSRAGSLAGRAGELLGLGLAKKAGGSRPSSRSAVSSAGVDPELRAAAREMDGTVAGGENEKKRRPSRGSKTSKPKKVADGPRPDTAGDPCGVQADIEWGRVVRGEALWSGRV